MHRTSADFTGNRRLIVAMLVAAVLWLALLRAAHVHEAGPNPNGDRVELCDICAQLSSPAGIVAAPTSLAWFAVWSVITFVVSPLGALSSRLRPYQARGPPRP